MGEPSDHSNLAYRIRSWAKQHASERSSPTQGSKKQRLDLLAHTSSSPVKNNNNALGSPSGSTASRQLHDEHGSSAGIRTKNSPPDATSAVQLPPALPQDQSEDAGTQPPTVEPTVKPAMSIRMVAGIKRFAKHTKDALFHSWINLLLIFVPAGIACEAAGLNPSIIFAVNAIAIIPLAGLLSYATESVASKMGDTIGALMNVTFGNAVELIIFIIALVKNEIRIVQASLIGSILANLLLILGMAFLFGGLRFREQIYNNTVTQMSACLLSLSVTSLLLPTAFHASFSDSNNADDKTLRVSRGTSVVLLLVYVLYLVFQLKSHAYMYESTPQRIIDEESHPGVLAEMLASSSSSDNSDSSTDSDSDTSGSHTTTNRIKRAFRHRRRRKSSASSATNTPSIPSALSSPSVERPGNAWENHSTNADAPHPTMLGAITSGAEADTDGEYERPDADPRVRDFVNEKPGSMKAPGRKHKKKDKKKSSKRAKDDKHIELDEKASPRKQGKTSAPQDSRPKVGFVDDAARVAPGSTNSARRAFGIRQLSSRQGFPRPALPKVLSNNVFVTPPPTNSPNLGPSMPPRSAPSGIRRTNSLPDRLNRQQLPSGTARDPIPPYQGPCVSADLPEDSEDGELVKPAMSRTSAAVLLLISTALVATCAEFLVSAIPDMIDSSNVSQAFIGLIILPIVGNAAEHVTAVTVATKNKMDLAIGVSVGSSIQIALFVTPLVVLLGWILGRDMSLYFNLFETISLFVTAFVVNFLVLDGRSNYLEGSLLIAAYVIIGLGAFFYPDSGSQSAIGGGTG
ncbi:hypothetical protein LTR50_000259 [Elasticomyces elasticus]|nr:hypothetical protein LTR50_000259 [Elasticomyces elasticus]